MALPPMQLDTINSTNTGFHEELVNLQQGNRLDLGPDLILCEGKSVTLTAPAGFSSYVWNNGYAGNTLVINDPGRYHCTVRDFCGLEFSDTIMVADNGSIELIMADEMIVCKDERLEVKAEQGYVRYRWGPDYNLVNNAASPSLIAKPALDTAYFVQAENNTGCFIYDTIRIHVKQAPALSLGQNNSICPGDSILLRSSQVFHRYLWSDGSVSAEIRVKKNGQYILTGYTADGCKSSDTVLITLKDCGSSFFMPNVFTPNGDGLNDIIRPITKGDMVQFQMQIYNRWGQLVFSSNDPFKGWDGKLNGILQGPQTYTWSCVWQVEGGERKRNNGSLALIR
jgi:gliding motility-associated-like protein